MTEHADADLTLPPVVAALHGGYREPELVLTIVYHPDPSRIGDSAVVPRRCDQVPWLLGRHSPAFAPAAITGTAGSGGGDLGDRHISRQALAFSARGPALVVRRVPDSSRCRLAGRELEGEVELAPEQLLAGVPLLLGHGVVLLLRLGAQPVAGESAPLPGGLLRGSGARMAALREQIAQVAGCDLDLLIRGETGTGKELVAATVHRASRRAAGPLVSVNMAAVPPGLAAAALFGNARGAFTGAGSASEGYFRAAEGGTLFLDEIGDTPPEIQPQLLRALQQREIQCVGGPVRRVDVRVVSATDAVLEGEGCGFRAALRHRLGACEIVVPPLRERPEDIGELLLHFLRGAAEETGSTAALPGEECSAHQTAAWAELFHGFLCYRWPGNVRELENYARQLVVASDGLVRLPEQIAAALRRAPVESSLSASAPAPAPAPAPRGRRRSLDDIDEREFDGALRAGRHEVAAVAKALGVSRQAVYRRIEQSAHHRLAGQVPLAELERVLAEQGGDAAAAALVLRVSLSGLRARLRACGIAAR
jgi:DNA-binding NtrC family response regulator